MGATTKVDRGERPGLTTTRIGAVAEGEQRVRQLEAEVEILRTVATLFGGEPLGSKRSHPVIDSLADAGHPTKVCCRLLDVSSPGYYMYKTGRCHRHGCAVSGSPA